MTAIKTNPESVVLSQMDEQWCKFLTFIVWKYHNNDNGVVITLADMQRYQADFESGNAFLLTHGHHDSIEFKIVTKQRAEELAAWDGSRKGSA